MLAMPGLRAFSLSAGRGRGVSCGPEGVFVGHVPLLQGSPNNADWNVRSISDINDDLTALYRLPIDAAAKANALALIAKALNRGDLAMAAIVAVQMQFPDPPEDAETPDEAKGRAKELFQSRLLKFWDPAQHPRAGTPPNPGWFAAEAETSETTVIVPAAMRLRPWEKPPLLEGGEGGGVPRGTLELPFPSGLPRLRWPGESASPPTPEGAPQRTWTSPDPSSKLPFMNESEPQLKPFEPGGKTSGIFKSDSVTVELQSGYNGPSAEMPAGSPGFDARTMAHVEAQAAALMRQKGISEGTLSINNPQMCERCTRLLDRMLPPGATLNVILPDGTVKIFKGITR